MHDARREPATSALWRGGLMEGARSPSVVGEARVRVVRQDPVRVVHDALVLLLQLGPQRRLLATLHELGSDPRAPTAY